MANITNYLNKIKSAVYGKDVRSSIYGGIDAINQEVESTTARQDHLERVHEQLIINAGTSNAEVVDARVDRTTGKSYDTVGKRMDDTSAKLDETNAQLSEIMSDIDLLPQSSLPAKQGISSNSPKLFIKIDDDNYKILQKADIGYIEYKLHKVRGDSSVSYGVSWDLLRLVAVQQVLECFVWKEPEAMTGTITTSIDGSDWNAVDNLLVYKKTSFQESNRRGLTLYDLAPNSEATFEFTSRKNGIANILYLSNTARSESVEIYVNDILVKSFSSNKGHITGEYKIESFPVVSSQNTSEKYTVKIKNKDTKKFSFVAFNFFSLKDFSGEEVDSYKRYQMNSYFINEIGASDYALKDKDSGKWFGSYHGGEVAIKQVATWNGTKKLGEDFFARETELTAIQSNSFTIVNNLRILQKTRLTNRADMISIFDFNVDGTMNMNFSLSNSDIKVTDFYTALTCTHTEFDVITYPKMELINTNDDNFYKIQNGYIEQSTSTGTKRVGIRYTIFNNKYNTKGHFIRNNQYYSKFYYGIVADYSNGVVVPNLTFSKSLDFYNVRI